MVPQVQMCTYDCDASKSSDDDAGYCAAAQLTATAAGWHGRNIATRRSPSAAVQAQPSLV